MGDEQQSSSSPAGGLNAAAAHRPNLGLAQLPLTDNDPSLLLVNVVLLGVLPQFRRKGIATQLMSQGVFSAAHISRWAI
jgi:ribosomal protein S18 acetylase RimI-like enzyme